MTRFRFTVLASLLALYAAHGLAGDRVLRAELMLDSPVERVWQAWTTEEGVRRFFAPAARIELRVDGEYAILFDPSKEPGKRGADGMRILAVEPMRRLVFTWNAPVDQPYVRAQRTVVSLEFDEVGAKRTRLRFTHSGWGEGKEWDAAYAYFDAAWNRFVLPALRHSLETGPIDWVRRPNLEPIAPTLRVELLPAKQP
jgi:uncharacterized protein YndB with AHSA1/START domain